MVDPQSRCARWDRELQRVHSILYIVGIAKCEQEENEDKWPQTSHACWVD